MAEFTAKTLQPQTPSLNKKVMFVKGTSAANNDTLTVSGLSSVEGAVLVATDGTAGTLTFATNVITVTNGGTKTWSGLAWGEA